MTERQPQMGSSEGRENRENLPTEVSIYAIDWMQTHEDRVSKGFSWIRHELKKPIQHTEYAWEGDFRALPGEESKTDPSYKDGLYSLFDKQEDMNKSASNLSWHYLLRGNPELDKQGKASFKFTFSLPQQFVEEQKSGRRNYGEGHTLRSLRPSEQKKFMEAMQEANKKNLQAQREYKARWAKYSTGTLPPPPTVKKAETQENREGQSQITVFVQEQEWLDEGIQTKRRTEVKQLQKPEMHLSYGWQGKLWRKDKEEYKLDVVSSNTLQNLKDLASNLAQNILSNKNPNVRSSYRTGFDISAELVRSIKKGDASNVINHVRRLTPDEEQMFRQAVKEAMEKLQK